MAEVQITLSYEQLGSCADSLKVNMEFARKKALNSHKNKYKVKGTCVQACEKCSDFPTGQLKRKLKLSHAGQNANMKIESLLWTAAHLFT